MSGRTRVFLDANVLRAPVTRTLILGAEERSEYRAVWSAYAEAEAERNQPPGQAKVSAVRTKLLRELTSAGGNQDAYGHTPEGDRQILADARQAGAVYVITNDVDDFAAEPLSMDHKLPTIQNRGPRCTRCAQLRSALRDGVCKACRK